MQPRTISIPSPCHESWDAMHPTGGGRHCDACCKTVIDFTGWEPQDIIAYLQENTSTCGRFSNSQLNKPITEDEQRTAIRNIWLSNLSYIKKIAAVIILFFASFLSACTIGATGTKEAEQSTENTTTGEPIYQPLDTLQQDEVNDTLYTGMTFTPFYTQAQMDSIYKEHPELKRPDSQ